MRFDIINYSIIFDLDGTLWDATDNIVIAWEYILKKHNVNLNIGKDEIKSVLGLTSNEIAEKLFKNLSLEKRNFLISECENEEITILSKNGGKLYKNVLETLNLLKNKFNLYIVSNCQNGYIEAFLNYYKLNNYFKDFECSGRTKLPKYENINNIIKKNNIINAIYVGDTIGDFNATKKSNIPFIYASYGFGNVKNTKHSINDIKDIISILENDFK